MTGVFSETGYGGVYYGSEATRYARKHPRTTEWLKGDHQLRENILIASEYCAQEFANAGSQVERQEITELCNEHITDLIFGHMPVDVMWEQDPPSWSWLLPTPELVSKWTGTAVPFMQDLMDHEWSRTILKSALWNAAAAVSGFAIARTGEHLVKKDFPKLFKGYKGVKLVGRVVSERQFGLEFNKWMNNVKNTSLDVWQGTMDEKRGVDPLRDSESYYNLEYGENRMPYNRRTGQWYPSRRTYGSRSGGYRRRSYGNRSYGNSYAPRRRRTYRRSYSGQW